MSRAHPIVRAGAALAIAFVIIAAAAWGTMTLARPQAPVNIHVRWKTDLVDAQRAELERRFGLTAGQAGEGTTWAYALTDTSTANIRALIQDQHVDDTDHLNRIRYRPEFAQDRSRQNLIVAAVTGAIGSFLVLVLLQRRSSPTVLTLDQRFEWRRLCTSAAIVTCVLTALWIWVPPAYDTNDDAAIRAALEGTLIPGQPPTGFALLPHAALGWFLVGIERAWPGAYVWDAALIVTLACGLAVLAALIWRSFPSTGASRLLAISIAVVVLLPLAGSVQYTISATVAGGAAMALAWSELQRQDRVRRSVLIMAALLLIAGLMVRSTAAIAGVLAVIASSLPRVVQERRRGITTMAALAAGSFVLFGLLHAADVALYKTRPQWEAYRQVYYMVTTLFEWNRQNPIDAASRRSAGGWTTNDWDMFQDHWAVTPAVFNPAQVANVYEATAASVRPWDPVVAVAGRIWTFDRRNFAERMQETWPALLAVLVIVIASARGHDLAAGVAAFALFGMYCLLIQAVFKDLPFRLFAPLAACFAVAVLSTRRRHVTSGPATVVGVLAMLLLAGYQATTVVASMRSNHRHSLQVDAEGAALAALHPSLVVMHSDTFPAEHWWRPFHRPGVALPTIRLGRNSNQNPQLLAFLNETGRPSFPLSICDDPSVLVVGEPGALEVLSRDVRDRTGRAITWDPVYKASFRAYRCVPAR